MNIMKNKLLFTIARIRNCWEHHQDGSDLRKSHESHLFSLVFNDLSSSLSGNMFTPHCWIDKYEEGSVRDILKSEQEFKEYWDEINILEIIHASIRTNNRGNILIGETHYDIRKKAPKDYLEKMGEHTGFLTSNHKFVDRITAAQVALDAGQIAVIDLLDCPDGLTTEHLLNNNGYKYDLDKGYYKEEETLKIQTW